MTLKFPEIKEYQAVLVRADLRTGIILDETLKRATTDEQKVYSVFDSKEEAIKAAENIVNKFANVECIVYDHMEKVLRFIEGRLVK